MCIRDRAWVLYQLLPLLTMIMIAFLLVYVVLPLVNFLTSIRIPYAISAISAFIIIMALSLIHIC